MRFNSLSDDCFAAIQSAEMPSAPAGSSHAKRRVIDAVTKRAVRQFHRHHAATAETREKIRRRFEVSTPAAAGQLCGFGILGFLSMELLGWLVSKAFDWLWDQWQQGHLSRDAVCGLVAEIGDPESDGE